VFRQATFGFFLEPRSLKKGEMKTVVSPDPRPARARTPPRRNTPSLLPPCSPSLLQESLHPPSTWCLRNLPVHKCATEFRPSVSRSGRFPSLPPPARPFIPSSSSSNPPTPPPPYCAVVVFCDVLPLCLVASLPLSYGGRAEEVGPDIAPPRSRCRCNMQLSRLNHHATGVVWGVTPHPRKG
jgi:hypothetical protein